MPPDAHHHIPSEPAGSGSGAGAAVASSGRGRTLYVFRSLLVCGLCGMRMWGNRRHGTRYYTCQPDRQRPRPPMVYIGETPLLTAVTGHLSRAIYGPDRVAYWQHALTAADRPDPAAPARDRLAELHAETDQLDRQIHQQLLSLEAPDVNTRSGSSSPTASSTSRASAPTA